MVNIYLVDEFIGIISESIYFNIVWFSIGYKKDFLYIFKSTLVYFQTGLLFLLLFDYLYRNTIIDEINYLSNFNTYGKWDED